MIDVLLSAIEKLSNVAVDLAYFAGTAIDELIDRLSSYIQHRYRCHKAYRDEGDQDKGQDKLVFYFHCSDRHSKK
ncbi:hypothetical protein [Pseudomonas gingeri]|uniref:hypothetical protein n=1 Tax=Pseudomonas TaxID=286 RepID=UPI0002E0F9D7|nr:hypothetical protein [Pseudomonas gingeri]